VHRELCHDRKKASVDSVYHRHLAVGNYIAVAEEIIVLKYKSIRFSEKLK
jgi:hypothetical protein